MRKLSTFLLTAGFMITAAMTQNAQADGLGAISALKANMARARIHLPFNINNVDASPTLVKGIYALENKGTSSFEIFINETGTIFGNSNGWQKVGVQKELSAEEKTQIRTELLENIDTDKLIKNKFGDGGNRRMVLFSAIDCPACFSFEQTLKKFASSLNTTFYVVPGSLQDISLSQKGQQNWQTAANIWCDQNNVDAWRSYWTKPAPIAGQRCQLSLNQAFNSSVYLKGLLGSIGIKIAATPIILREDGNTYFPQVLFDKKYAQDNFSKSALDQIDLSYFNKEHHWF